MADSVTIVVAGEDQSGAVLDAVNKHLEEVRRRAEATDKQLVAIGGHAVPAMAAASASVRILDGDFTHLMRAEERFLSMLPGASALMQAAFPVIGVVAVATGIYRAIDATEQYIQTNREMATTIERDFNNAQLQFDKTNDDLRVTNDRLAIAIARLEHKPENGLKLALDEARVSADRLSISIEGDNQKIAQLMEKNSVGLLGNLATGTRTTEDAEKLFKGYQEQAREITYAGQERERAAQSADDAQRIRTETQNKLLAAQKDWLDKISDKLKEVEGQRDEENAMLTRHGVKPSTANDAAINDLEALRAAISSQADNIQLVGENEALQKEKDLQDAKKQTAQFAEAERKREEEWLNKVQNLGVGNSPQARLVQMRDAAKLAEEVDKENQRQAEQLTDAYVRDAEQRSVADIKASNQEIARLREVQEARIRAAGEDAAVTARTTEFNMRMGRISEADKIAAIRQASSDEVAIKQNALSMIATLDSINPDNPAKVQKDLDQIAELQKQHSQQMIELDQQEALSKRDTAARYLHDVLDPLMNRPKSIQDAFKRMADSILGDLERIAEDRVMGSLVGGFNTGISNQSSNAGRIATARQSGGFGGALGGLLGRIVGLSASKGSNGGLATGAGTIADTTVSQLQQGRAGTGAGSAPVVNIINQGTPQQVQSSGSSGDGKFESLVLSIVLKDADTGGPMSQALGGAIKMLGMF